MHVRSSQSTTSAEPHSERAGAAWAKRALPRRRLSKPYTTPAHRCNRRTAHSTPFPGSPVSLVAISAQASRSMPRFPKSRDDRTYASPFERSAPLHRASLALLRERKAARWPHAASRRVDRSGNGNKEQTRCKRCPLQQTPGAEKPANTLTIPLRKRADKGSGRFPKPIHEVFALRYLIAARSHHTCANGWYTHQRNTRLTKRFSAGQATRFARKARYDWGCAVEEGKRRRTHTLDHAHGKGWLSSKVGSGRPLGNTERHCAGAAGPEHSAGVRYRRRRRRIPGG